MDTAWIQVFVLTMSECVAPAGKNICQEREYEIEFTNRAACEITMQQLVTLKGRTDDIIVNKDRTRCDASAREQEVYASVDAINTAFPDELARRPPEVAEKAPDFTQKAHKERLASLPTCEEAGGAAPCKIGEIIVEAETEQSAEVWRRVN